MKHPQPTPNKKTPTPPANDIATNRAGTKQILHSYTPSTPIPNEGQV